MNEICTVISTVRGLTARVVALTLVPLLLAGCFQLERTVQVRADGTGVLVERMVMSNQMVEMAAGMQQEGQEFKLRDDEKLAAKAANYGDSVRFHSAEDVTTDFGKGYVVRYEFDDINKLRVGKSADDASPSGGSGSGKDSQYTTFTMTPGNPAELLVHWSTGESDKEATTEQASTAETTQPERTPEQKQQAEEMMRQMMQDMRMALHVEVLGSIAETNATHVDGSRVTLLDIDFNELLENEEALESMATKKPETPEDMKALMRLVPGMKIEIEKEVSIRFN